MPYKLGRRYRPEERREQRRLCEHTPGTSNSGLGIEGVQVCISGEDIYKDGKSVFS